MYNSHNMNEAPADKEVPYKTGDQISSVGYIYKLVIDPTKKIVTGILVTSGATGASFTYDEFDTLLMNGQINFV
jgi:hypothetical protein